MENIVSSSALEILSADDKLMSLLEGKPSTMMIPFTKSRESFFLLVSLVISNDHNNFDGIASACLHSLNDLLVLDFVSGLPAIKINVWEEVVRTHPQQHPVEKVFRLSVENEAFTKAHTLTIKDLLLNEPLDGVRCSRPIERPA